jgi:hypothetical protein
LQIEPSSDAQKDATSAITFVLAGVGLLLFGYLTFAVLSFVFAGYSARLWNAKNQLRPSREKLGGDGSIQEDSATEALSAILRASFDLKFVRKSLAVLSFVLFVGYLYLSQFHSSPFRHADDGTFYTVLLLLNVCLYWCLGFRIPTYFRRWIASGALCISVWIWIWLQHDPYPDLVYPPEILRAIVLIYFPMKGVFITLALISWVDDEGTELQQPRHSVT